MSLFTKILIIPTMTILFAVSPDWQDDPGAYQFTATIEGGIVLNINGEQMGDEGDMFAAFDNDGNVRGVGLMLFPPFGPYQGTPVFEVQLRSNDAGDILYFQYYDASTHIIFDINETYIFVINEINIGNVEDPKMFNMDGNGIIEVYYSSDVDIGGFQFAVEGVTVTGASGGAAEAAGFMISSSATTVLGFSLSGSEIPAGCDILVTLDIEDTGEPCLDNTVISDNSGNPLDAEVVDCTTINLWSYINGCPKCTVLKENYLNSDNICVPMDFASVKQSTLQAFYMFYVVIINESEVESNDWVGAFNGDVCVGARKWDTSQCGNEICEVPVFGDDGSDGTVGYMNMGEIPSFKIYDASSGEYYDATPSEIEPWQNFAFINIASLEVMLPISGCTDPDYCNYDPSATEDDGSCNYLCTGCTDESACNYSENATIDDESCYYEGIYDCASNCIAELDCAGVCGGSVVLDICGECDNYIATNGTQPDFPYGDCDCLGTHGGSAYNDNCGECDDDASNDCVQDCNEVWGGSSNEDNCGTCDNNVSNDCVKDCSGAWGGDLVIDECGVCDGPGSTSECGCGDIQVGFCDCDENKLDQCGICNGDDSTCADCAGDPNGNAVLDNCGECNNDNTNDCMQDCNGNWGGDAVIDDCGICDNDITNDCIQDCAGIWGGTAKIDECEICNGDGPEENYDCGGNCIEEVNCLGECDNPNGQYSPHFQCENGNVACNPADCNSLDILHYLLPDEFGISKIFPNPFNPITQIQYELTQFGLISIKIYNIQGRIVDQLMKEYQSPGHYSLNWNAVNHASGMYIVEMLMQLANNEVSRDFQKILYLK